MINRLLPLFLAFFLLLQSPKVSCQEYGARSRGLGGSIVGSTSCWGIYRNPSLMQARSGNIGVEFSSLYGIPGLNSFSTSLVAHSNSRSLIGVLFDYSGIKHHNNKDLYFGFSNASKTTYYGCSLGFGTISRFGERLKYKCSLSLGISEKISESIAIVSSIYNVSNLGIINGDAGRVALGAKVGLGASADSFLEFEFDSKYDQEAIRLGIDYSLGNGIDLLIGFNSLGGKLTFSGLYESNKINYGIHFSFHPYLGVSPALSFTR